MANKLFDKIVREELINVLNEQRGVLYKDNPGSKKGGMSPSQMAAIGGRLKIKRGDKITYDRHFRFGKVSRDEVGTVVAFDGKHKLQLDDGPQLDLRITPIKKINGKVIKEQAWANKDGKPLDFEYDPGKGKLKEDYSQRARNFRVNLRMRMKDLKKGGTIGSHKYKMIFTKEGPDKWSWKGPQKWDTEAVVKKLNSAAVNDIMKWKKGASGAPMVRAFIDIKEGSSVLNKMIMREIREQRIPTKIGFKSRPDFEHGLVREFFKFFYLPTGDQPVGNFKDMADAVHDRYAGSLDDHLAKIGSISQTIHDYFYPPNRQEPPYDLNDLHDKNAAEAVWQYMANANKLAKTIEKSVTRGGAAKESKVKQGLKGILGKLDRAHNIFTSNFGSVKKKRIGFKFG